jgi:hypothetical protein
MIVKRGTLILVACGVATCFSAFFVPLYGAQPQQAPGGTRMMGTVKAVSADLVTVTSDSGAEVGVAVPETARVVRTEPGQKDLTGAAPIRVQDIEIGDRVLVKGKPSDDGKSLVASSVIVMKKSDIAQKQASERADWQRRGIGGRVTAVDPAAGTVAVSMAGFGGSKTVMVRVSSNTRVRRYAPQSVKFDDSLPAKLDEIKVGDQLRARGSRNPDGTELSAEEIVAGTFRNIAGTVLSIDAAKGTFTVMDLASKQPVAVRISADSQMRKLPPMLAQGIAMRLKGGAGPNGSTGAQAQAPAARSGGEQNGGPPAGHGDLNQMLSHLPAITVAGLQKGDAVMIVSTEGAGAEVTAITMLTGVEPILTAPNNAMILSPWNLSAGGESGGSE